MTAYASTSERYFVRDADRAILGGVCAGFANYFGFNLRVTRILFIIACCVATPFAVIAYIAIVFLVPAESSRYEYVTEREVRRTVRRKKRRMTRKERQQAAAEEQAQAAAVIKERYSSLDDRLARIEKYITSSRYDLDREFRNL
jgi:phage shock protein C